MTRQVPEGYAGVIPFLVVRDMGAAIEFAESVFGFERSYVNEQDGRIVHAELAFGGRVALMLAPEGAHGELSKAPATSDRASFAEVLVYVPDAVESHRLAVAAGAVSVGEPKDESWGERIGQIIDPEGYRWVLVQNLPDGDSGEGSSNT